MKKREEEHKHLLKGSGVGFNVESKQEAPTCIGCGKEPADINEYKQMARDNDYRNADVAMRAMEGTFNKFAVNKFYCTPCYVKAGAPLLPRGGR